MFEWSEELQMVRDAVRTFVDNEIRPHREELEHGDLPPYDLLRKLYKTFGMDQMAADSFDKRIAAEEAAAAATPRRRRRRARAAAVAAGFTLLPIIELCKCSPGMVTAMGVSVGLTAAAIMSKGTIAQKKRWARDLLTMDKIGAWAITEPELRLRRVRVRWRRPRAATATSTCSTARRRSSRTARTPTRSCSSASSTRATRRPSARSCSSCSTTGMPGLEQSKPLRKMGLHSSPTGMLFLDDVRVGRDRLLGESEEAFGGGKGREASQGDVRDGALGRRRDGARHHRAVPRAVA